jgi:hypothetical protein
MPGAAPVSDRSLHLWLSAIVGLWFGIAPTLQTVLLPFSISPPRWPTITTAAIGTALSVCAIAAAPRVASRAARMRCAILSLLCLALGLMLGNLAQPGFYDPFLGKGILTTLYEHAFGLYWWLRPALLARYVYAWSAILICTLAFRALRGPRLALGSHSCPACAYDTSALLADAPCPECGRHHAEALRWVQDRAHRCDRTVRSLCRAGLAAAALVILLSALPDATIQRKYAHLNTLGVRYGSTYGAGPGIWDRSVLYLVTSNGRTAWVQIDLARAPGNRWRGKVTSRLFSAYPHDPQTATPVLQSDGLIPEHTIVTTLGWRFP